MVPLASQFWTHSHRNCVGCSASVESQERIKRIVVAVMRQNNFFSLQYLCQVVTECLEVGKVEDSASTVAADLPEKNLASRFYLEWKHSGNRCFSGLALFPSGCPSLWRMIFSESLTNLLLCDCIWSNIPRFTPSISHEKSPSSLLNPLDNRSTQVCFVSPRKSFVQSLIFQNLLEVFPIAGVVVASTASAHQHIKFCFFNEMLDFGHFSSRAFFLFSAFGI